jgi:peptidyl-prolyl cis-trans isomerase A (cyclophilin A)
MFQLFRLLCCPLAFALLHVSASAQIYADFAIAEGGSPLGTFRVELHHERAPRPVANFIGLATGARNWISPETGAVQIGVPYYDGLRFHRLVHDFVIQGGDPLGTGAGGPGYVFQDQFDPTLRHVGPYVLSMAHAGPHSNGSQFFITLAAAPGLDDLHSVFGTVIDDASFPGSRALIDGFMSSADFPTDAQDRPLTALSIDSVTLSGPDLAGFDLEDPALGLPKVDGLALRLRHDATAGSFFVQWAREGKWDYAVYSSPDLQTWTRADNLLSMDAAPGAEVDVSGLFAGSRGFATMAAVDYGHTPDLPQTIFAAGDRLNLEIDGGRLSLDFDGNGAGSWSFEEDGGAVTSGLITQYGAPQDSSLFSIPESGLFSSGSMGVSTLARSLAAREVVVFFDGPVGPNAITAIQPVISFHTDTTGWYSGPVNAESALPGPFRGTFEWVPAAP